MWPTKIQSKYALSWCSAVMYCIQKWIIQGNNTNIFETIGNNNLNLMLFLDIGKVSFPLNKQVGGFEGSCSSFHGKCLKTNHEKLNQKFSFLNCAWKKDLISFTKKPHIHSTYTYGISDPYSLNHWYEHMQNMLPLQWSS